MPVGLTFGAANGTHTFNSQIPNNTTYIGVNLAFQMVRTVQPGPGPARDRQIAEYFPVARGMMRCD